MSNSLYRNLNFMHHRCEWTDSNNIEEPWFAIGGARTPRGAGNCCGGARI